jgi:hypothetical protein
MQDKMREAVENVCAADKDRDYDDSDYNWGRAQLARDVLAAMRSCDETCKWARIHIVKGWQFGDGWRPGCIEDHDWFDHGREGMVYCPHCGRKIEEVRDAG